MGGGNLPPELEGQDLMPDDLEKLKGDDKTEMQRVIICFYEKDKEYIAQILGVEAKTMKVVYELGELKKDK